MNANDRKRIRVAMDWLVSEIAEALSPALSLKNGREFIDIPATGERHAVYVSDFAEILRQALADKRASAVSECFGAWRVKGGGEHLHESYAREVKARRGEISRLIREQLASEAPKRGRKPVSDKELARRAKLIAGISGLKGDARKNYLRQHRITEDDVKSWKRQSRS